MSPDNGSSRSRRGVWTHWVPLAVTVTVATAGVAVWAWSQRKKEDDDEHEPGLDYGGVEREIDSAPYGSQNTPPDKPPRPDDQQSNGIAPVEEEPATWGARMSGALRRTPSPQHFFDSTGKTVAAGVAAAGAVMGKALASIREEDKSAYGDNNPWSEEADAKQERAPPTPASPSTISGGKKRKTVAIVVSADSNDTTDEGDGFHEHASILSHISRNNDWSKVKLFVLIYAPQLKDAPLDAPTSNLPPPSLSSSYSNIGHDQAQTPGEETKNPLVATNPVYNAIYREAVELVEKPDMVLPFTTPNGHVHILRHLQPEVIYLQESLSGEDGMYITSLQTWLRYDVILVVGADGGSGGLADSESEVEKSGSGRGDSWWQRTERVGRGRGVIVVDGMRVTDDWARRVQGQE